MVAEIPSWSTTPSALGLYDMLPSPSLSSTPSTAAATTPTSFTSSETSTPPTSPPTASTTPSATGPPDLGFTPPIPPPSLPESGPAFYHVRRALWLTPREGMPRQKSPSTSRLRLEEVMGSEGSERSEEVWEGGVKNVWKGLVAGGKLRKSLPLWVGVKILKAGWIRDGTWPEEMEPPSSPPQHNPLKRSHPSFTQSWDDQPTSSR